MNANAVKLISSRVVNKIGNVLYDYGNNAWMASLGTLGQQFLGFYQLTDLLIAIVLNPFGGAIADRFKRRKILLWADALCAMLCFGVAFISQERLMLYALIGVNAVLAISSAFSSPANKSFTTAVVTKEELVTFNANLEVALKIISVSAPILSYAVLKLASLQATLVLDGISFVLSFLLVFAMKVEEEQPNQGKAGLTFQTILGDIVDGARFIFREKEVFFLLMVASLVNTFIAALNYLLPFTDKLYAQAGSYATLLSLGAGGAIAGALIARKVPNTMNALLVSLCLCGVSLILLALPIPVFLAQSGHFFFELFLTIFNIHFFSQVQTRVPNDYLGRVFSTIFTLAILFMPFGTLFMTLMPNTIQLISFAMIGLGIAIFSLGSMIYLSKNG
ncbi:MFS transporter [Streptococcus merionis]|uniref:MFS transporter n=1 Tax=Streptococcus merionis TaxID=400065 RepID=UPI0026EE0660|nr:MFS transporter [Streptococcus merionis]